ncbi:serine hydrolase [Solirubrobacter ginsenosidimutans]|uniref:Serine hydrolase n=1 Tax=Solirubrobacter ginsenosidimutans TaxID=490573 RepID=A0A9X3MLV0_9ACTN|nr:serine hydrolase [Solirubrobacter ginsenosidimutans]MDA0158779.1 serine hydrolase [Solirubrobacter ginsenosidimutans]
MASLAVVAAAASAEPTRGGDPGGNTGGAVLDDSVAGLDPHIQIAPAFPQTTAAAAIVVDRATGTVLGSNKPDRRWAPASTTKIMTGLLTAEKIRAGTVSLSDTVTIQSDVSIEGGKSIGLAPGDTISLQDLLNITLIDSDGDAASAVGTYVGSQPWGDPSWMGRAQFVQWMNDRAGELGLTNTRYIDIAGRDPEDLGRENDDGLWPPDGYWPTQEVCSGNDFNNPPCGHYTTARDLAALARVALDEPLFARIVARPSWRTTTWRSASGGVLDRTVYSSNELLPGGTAAYPGAYGVKTGTTNMARQNLVSAAATSTKDVIAVVLGSDDDSTVPGDRYTDSRALLDWALR